MAIKKIEIRPKGDGTYQDVLYPKTSADMVVTTDGKTVQTEINDLKSSVSDGKQLIATAITGKNVPTNGSDTFQVMATNIGNIAKDTTALANEIRTGKTAYIGGSKVTGTAPVKAVATITPGTANQTIASGTYLTGTQTILGDADLIASNIKTGVNIFGVLGNLTPGTRTASGTAPSTAPTEPFEFTTSGTSGYRSFIEVKNIGFTPSTIITWVVLGTHIYYALTIKRGTTWTTIVSYTPDLINTSQQVNVEHFKGNARSGYVNSTGFKIPISAYSEACNYLAVE